MDKKLLDALNNLSDSLQEIADALRDSGGGGNKAPTTEALQMGNFGGDMMAIVASIKSVKQDTQEILKQQKTILNMSRKQDQKTDMFEKAGDKKSESNVKKGVGTILLIAVAVLAIGAAFKLVGNVDFFSVIALSMAMFVLAEAFARIGVVVAKMSLRDVLRTGLALVAISVAVTISSHILKKTASIGFPQILSAGLIIGMFAAVSRSIQPLIEALSGNYFTRLRPRRLLLGMVAISAGIVASSKILTGTVPVSAMQMFSAILIAGMFAVVSINFDKLAQGLASTWFTRLTPGMLLRGMLAIAAGITFSSWLLKMVTPISLSQAVTAILIAAMFAVMSMSFHKLAMGLRIMQGFTAGGFSMGGVNKMTVVIVMAALAAGITISSWIMSMIKPISFTQFLTALGIALLFAGLSFVMPMLAAGIMVMNNTVGAKKGIVIIPLIFTALSLGIMLSSHILSMSAEMDFVRTLKLALFGIALGIMILATLPAVVAVGLMSASGVGAGAIVLGAAMIPIIAAGVMISSHILAAGNYDGKYPSISWALGSGAAMLSFSAAMISLGAIAITGVGALAIAAGLVIVPLVAQAIVETAKVIGDGKYDKYPGPGWALTVAPLMLVFAGMVVALGALVVGTLGLGGIAIQKGLEAIPWIAQSIVNTARVIGTGKYDKYPGPGWALTVTPLMLAFAAMVVSLGVLSIMGLGLGAVAILAGIKWIPSIAWTIVQTSNVISKGKYDKYPGAEWALSVGGLMVAFSGMIVTIGGLIVASFGLGNVMLAQGITAVKMIARSIVSVAWIFSNSRAAFKNGPPKEWAEGVSLAMGAFSPIYKMLLLGGVVEAIFGSKVTPEQYAEAIRTIASGVVDAAKYFGSKEANVSFQGGPKKEWSEGVGKAIAAFAPVYKMLVRGGIMEVFTGKGPSIWGYVHAIKAISKGIVASAKIFAENKTTFDGGYPDEKWGKGVGSALKAFAPVLDGMKESSWFESGDEQINQMVRGIKKMTYAIVKVGYIFTKAKGVDWTAYPDKKWGNGLKNTLSDFLGIAEKVTDSSSVSNGWEVVSLAKSFGAVARVFSKNKAYFDKELHAESFVLDMKYALSAYMKIAYMVKKRVNAFWKNLGTGKDFMVQIAKSFVSFSKAMARGRGSFDIPMDPDFMRNIHGNVRYYLKILTMLRGQGGMGDKVQQLMLGTNPMKPLADGMIMLADAFDHMATSLGKFSSVMSTIDDKKIKSVVTMGTKAMASAKPQGFLSSVSSALGNVVQSAGGLVSGGMDRVSSIISPKSKSLPMVQRGKYGTPTEQMDRLIDTMRQIQADTKPVKDYMMRKIAEMEETSLAGGK